MNVDGIFISEMRLLAYGYCDLHRDYAHKSWLLIFLHVAFYIVICLWWLVRVEVFTSVTVTMSMTMWLL
jgi:hypothetical protein